MAIECLDGLSMSNKLYLFNALSAARRESDEADTDYMAKIGWKAKLQDAYWFIAVTIL